jgi:hypothetical protein
MRHSFLNREEVSGARNLSGLAKQINPAIGWAGMYKHPLPPCAENVRSAAMRFGAGKHGVDRRAGVAITVQRCRHGRLSSAWDGRPGPLTGQTELTLEPKPP